MRGLGTAVNVLTILGGTIAGLLAGERLPQRARTTMLQGVGLVVIVLGITQAQETRNVMFPLAAIVLGGLAGEALRIEDRLESLGERLRARFGGEGEKTFVEGFVAASLVFCVGPLAVLGSIADGLDGDHQLLFVKAALDGLVAVVLAAGLGWGVAFSALPVLVYQGIVTLAASGVDEILSGRMVDELTATGGLMITAIGIRVLDLKHIRVGSFLPGLVIAPVLVALFAR